MNGDNAQIPRLVNRAFLVWSWLGLLSAYIATSALFVSQLYSTWREGLQAFRFSSIQATVFSLAQLFPVYTLVFAWLAFYSYSVAVFCVAIEDNASEVPISLPRQFRRSLLYIVISWLAALVLAALPVITQILYIR
jgi:hypothetical protein